LRGKKVRTTISRKAVAAGDRVNRQFVAERPDQLWVADFTYGVPGAYSALFDHGLASKSDQRFASIRSTGNLTFSTAF
ncbi:hypothetical protein PJ695_005089, partial [Escherichia coli]